MKALVTGGAGFIGSNLVDGLIARGDTVCVIDNVSTGRHENLAAALANGAELAVDDITDAAAVNAIVDHFKPDAIFHLAAQIDVRKSVSDPAFDALVNICGTINLLNAAVHNKVKRFVFSSTGGAAYGAAETIPTPEDNAINPEAPYGQAKVAAEGYVELFGRLNGLSGISLRYGNVYGPRQDPLGEAGVIAIFCGCALTGKRPTIYGDGEQTRDYVHVDDVVAANVAAAESSATGAFNIGTGVETSVLRLAEVIAPFATSDFTPIFEPARAGELQRSCLSVGKAASELALHSNVTIDQGLTATLDAAREFV